MSLAREGQTKAVTSFEDGKDMRKPHRTAKPLSQAAKLFLARLDALRDTVQSERFWREQEHAEEHMQRWGDLLQTTLPAGEWVCWEVIYRAIVKFTICAIRGANTQHGRVNMAPDRCSLHYGETYTRKFRSFQCS